jgi:hypothetical protein
MWFNSVEQSIVLGRRAGVPPAVVGASRPTQCCTAVKTHSHCDRPKPVSCMIPMLGNARYSALNIETVLVMEYGRPGKPSASIFGMWAGRAWR